MSLRSEGFIFPSLLCFPTLLDSLNSLSYSFQVLSLVDGKRALVFFHEYFVTRYRITPENICSLQCLKWQKIAETLSHTWIVYHSQVISNSQNVALCLCLEVFELEKCLALWKQQFIIGTQKCKRKRKRVSFWGNYSGENVSISIEFPFSFLINFCSCW